MISIFLVDDHELIRSGIRRLLEDRAGFQVVGEAATGEEAVSAIRKRRPDVVLMDVNMPGIGGLEATRKLSLSYPDLPIIILTVHTEDPFPSRLLKAGASGYLHKGCSIDEMDKAVREVYAGRRYISSDIAQSLALTLLPGGGSPSESPFDDLSQREMQVMLMLIQGNKAQDIATKLCLSPKTVSTYRTRLLEKLGVRNDAELTRMAMRYGMLEGIE